MFVHELFGMNDINAGMVYGFKLSSSGPENGGDSI